MAMSVADASQAPWLADLTERHWMLSTPGQDTGTLQRRTRPSVGSLTSGDLGVWLRVGALNVALLTEVPMKNLTSKSVDTNASRD